MTARPSWRHLAALASVAIAIAVTVTVTAGCSGGAGSSDMPIQGTRRGELCDAVARPAAFTCPSGTLKYGKPPPDGTEMWCQRWDGTRHGPYRRFPPGAQGAAAPSFVSDGAVVGEYREGQQHGAWWNRRAGSPSVNVAYYDAGKLVQRVTCRL